MLFWAYDARSMTAHPVHPEVCAEIAKTWYCIQHLDVVIVIDRVTSRGAGVAEGWQRPAVAAGSSQGATAASQGGVGPAGLTWGASHNWGRVGCGSMCSP